MSKPLDDLWELCEHWDDEVNGLAERTNIRSRARRDSTRVGVELGSALRQQPDPVADPPPLGEST